MKEFKYKTTFSSVIRPVISRDKDLFLAKASLEQLRAYIPNIDLEANYDLLPVAMPLFNANYFNKNDDGVDTAFALKIYKTFINKFLDLEHSRDRVVGTILSVHITEFGTDKPLTEDDVRDSNDPFNITIGGVLWRVVNEGLAELIEDSNNILDDNYEKIKASFEVAFTDYKVVVLPANSRNLAVGKIIDEGKEFEELSQHLRAFGGTGKLSDGSRVFRLLAGEGIGLGGGIVEQPAAFLNPIAVKKEEETDAVVIQTEETEDSISHSQTLDVITNNNITRQHMKINSIKDITDDLLKEAKASSIVEFVETELKAASEKFAKEKQEKESQAQEIQKKHEELMKTHEQLMKDLESLKANLDKLEQEKAAKEKQEKFNVRMASFEDKYELSEEELAVVAAQIKDLDDEQYKNIEKNLHVLLKNKDKSVIAEAKKVQEAKASENKEENKEQVVDKAVDTAQKTTAEVAATQTITETKTLKEKYAKAFAPDQFNIIK